MDEKVGIERANMALISVIMGEQEVNKCKK